MVPAGEPCILVRRCHQDSSVSVQYTLTGRMHASPKDVHFQVGFLEFDASAHMTEENHNAMSPPIGVIMALAHGDRIPAILGWLLI